MSTMGEQRQFNYALKPMAKDEFVRMMTTDLPEVPAYFSRDAELNRTGAGALSTLKDAPRLGPDQVSARLEQGSIVLDVRSPAAFGAGHVPGSINIGLGGQFASWAGSLIPSGTGVVIVADDDDGVREAVLRLARVGVETVEGFLADGIYAWDRAGLTLGQVPQMPVDELKARNDEQAIFQLIDVRRRSEFGGGHVPGARNVQLADLGRSTGQFDPAVPTIVICGSGYRSSAATSILKRQGFAEVFNVVGGTTAWMKAEYEVETSA